MTDHAEEQAMELEALEAILADDLQGFDGTRPDGWRTDTEIHTIVIRPSEDAAIPSGELPLLAELVWAHTPEYPDEAPLVRARSAQGLSDADVTALQAVVEQQVQENMGMSMIYALVAAAQEWITEKATEGAAPEIDPVAARKAAEEAEERRLAEIRSHGTPVSPATFAPWKTRFYAELAAARARAATAAEGRKLTGKEYFLQSDGRGRDADGEEDGLQSADVSDEDIDYSDDDDDGMLEEEAEELVARLG